MPAAKLFTADLRAQVEAGERLVDIARATGYATSTIRRHCKAADIKTSKKKGPRRKLPHVVDMIAAMRTGTTAMEMARAHGVTRAAVADFLRRNGFLLRGGIIHPCPFAITSMSTTWANAHVCDIEDRVDLKIAARAVAA